MLLVASAAVGLRGRQEFNKRLDRKKNVLIAAQLFDANQHTNEDVDDLFANSIESLLIDLETGEPADSSIVDVDAYDQRAAARNPDLSVAIDPPNALSGIKRREKYAYVYQVKDEAGAIIQVVLPMYGKGLWSTLYGFLAVGSDGLTVEGITFYEHGETPGLGGEIENKQWQALWSGKRLLDDAGDIQIKVVKGIVDADSANAEYEIDGLSGATITSNGVTNLVRYWVGSDAFGPYLGKLRKSPEGKIDG